ncbi:hypothetical protein NIES4071_16700 [Calothrix sp. NIES-4071]|nr:hypothetical protein NIES4071_16700 [Calothrix sp. NIES-4071]BAZ56004.1 hypothetical protein NIES4105_16650 [Calothrix sp. NIES-4105]
MEIIKDLLGIFNIFEGIYERIKKILIPPRAYSWQTLIYLSLFSWIMSSLAAPPIKSVIAFFGWAFLIAGTSWYTTDQPILIPGTNMPVGAVITGFLVSVFAFGQEEDVITPRTIVLWPTIAAIITAIPEFFEGSGIDSKRQIPKAEVRQRIIVLVGSCLILSAWIQLYFTVDKWANQYPSLLADDFSRSPFVIRTGSSDKIPENGAIILNRIQPVVQQQIDAKEWSDVERWLKKAPNTKENFGTVNAIGRQVINDLSRQSGRKVREGQVDSVEEWRLWNVDASVDNVGNNKNVYRLNLLALWNGPSSSAKRYFLRKSCQIEPISRAADASTVNIKTPGEKITVAEIQCEKRPQFFAGTPPKQQ